VPEVFFDEAWIEVEDVLTEPDVHGCFSVVTSEVVNTAFLGPNVNHLSGSHSEGIGECSSHES